MCKLFIGGDPELWRMRLKSIRMRGFSTSLRLENLYWRILDEIAGRDGMSLTRLLVKLHDELLEETGDVDNFASFLRVCCGRYLMLQLAGEVPRDPAHPIRGLDADAILAREADRLRPRGARRPTTLAAPILRQI